ERCRSPSYGRQDLRSTEQFSPARRLLQVSIPRRLESSAVGARPTGDNTFTAPKRLSPARRAPTGFYSQPGGAERYVLALRPRKGQSRQASAHPARDRPAAIPAPRRALARPRKGSRRGTSPSSIVE